MTHPTPAPTSDELAGMTVEEMSRLGARLDGVELVEYGPRFVPGTPAEKRAERSVAMWFIAAAVCALAFVVIFCVWPATYQDAFSPNQLRYAVFTPMLGITLGASILFTGIGVMMIAKKIAPHEVAVQERHGGRSSEVDRRTVGAELSDTLEKTGLKTRRGVLKGSLLLAGGGLATAAIVAPIGGLIKNPWAKGADSELWVTLWKPAPDGTLVHLTQIDGTLVRPEDMNAGSMITVFPGVPGGAKASDSAVMLFRLYPGEKVRIRDGQDGFEYGDFYAFSKICTHVGCPVSLYEDQTNRVLCPCHQSQFDVANGGKPVFGPATRPLPQLPITVDKDGYFVAKSDFIEPVGPGFWESYQGSKPWSSHPKKENS
ncbi:MAG TPA: Rieske 2Fe-2S domain-containing protein [Nakamurella sp.]|nr:Rieske 2Fe-2S domain-containing protein [Nakamurella sp.]